MNFTDIFGSSTTATGAMIIVVTWLVIQVLKPAFGNNHYLPLASLIVGGVAGFIVALQSKDANVLNDVVIGLIAGFASTGLNETANKSITSFVNGILNGFGSNDESNDEQAQQASEVAKADELAKAQQVLADAQAKVNALQN